MNRPSYPSEGGSSPRPTLQRHLLDQLGRSEEYAGDLSGLLHQIALAGKIIASKVRRAGLADIFGLTGEINIQGEEVQKLDDFANSTLVHCVEAGGHVCIMGSEEVEGPISIPDRYPTGNYVLLFDPLDGSGNIDINASIGTIFSIHRRRSAKGPGELQDCLQAGRDMVAAGYIVYGSSNMLVYSSGEGVQGFTLDPSVGTFFLSHQDIRIPERGNTYSVNEGNSALWHEGVRSWVDSLKQPDRTTGKPYGLRYIGAMVADFHRTLLHGGIFAYPADQKNPQGKLRLLYEASPMSFIAEAAKGAASDGNQRILDIVPEALHQRTPLYIGSRGEVEDAVRFVGGK